MQQRSPLWPFLGIALFFSIYRPAFLPAYALHSFAPFLAISLSRLSFVQSLWMAAGCGIIIDLLSSGLPFSFHGMSYAFAVFILHRFRHFFVEKALGMCSFTIIFSFLLTLIECVLLTLIGMKLSYTWKGIGTDFILMPLFDGFYAFSWFYCPFVLYRFLKKQWRRLLFFREEFKKKKHHNGQRA